MIPVRNLYYLLCYAWESLEEAGSVDLDEFDGFDRIEDLFGLVLARAVTRTARRGLDRSYIDFEEELAGVRGKVELAATIKQASLVRHRLVCSFEDLSPDVIHNQIIASTLDVLARHQPLDAGVRREVRIALSQMRDVSMISLSGQAFSRVHLDRNRRAYRFLIKVCRLLHETRMVDQGSGQSRFIGLDLERITMWRVFETFAAKFFEKEQSQYQVQAQRIVYWFDLHTRGLSSRNRVPVMRPDLYLSSEERRIILDTKFYSTGGLADETDGKLDPGNLYQLFAYVVNRERAHPEGPTHEGMLLYPTVGVETRVDFTTHGHQFQARSVDLGRPWREIHDAMLRVLDISTPDPGEPKTLYSPLPVGVTAEA